jgi:amino acid transporter
MMRKETTDWMVAVSKILSWILSIIAIYWILLKLTNHSPTTDQIMLAVLGIIATGIFAIIGILIKMTGDITDIKADLRNHTRECDRRFYTLARDFKRHAEKGG